MTLASDRTSQSRRKGRRLCGAKTRAGGCCQVRAKPGKARCRFHGGKSTDPKTQAGRAPIAEAQRLRWLAYRDYAAPDGANLSTEFALGVSRFDAACSAENRVTRVRRGNRMKFANVT